MEEISKDEIKERLRGALNRAQGPHSGIGTGVAAPSCGENEASAPDNRPLLSISGVDPNYGGFIAGLGREGLKGMIKRLVLKVIGFFTWWQGQINTLVFRDLSLLEETISLQNGRIRNELAGMQIMMTAQKSSLDDLKEGIAEERKTVAYLKEEMVSLSRSLDRAESLLYREIAEQRVQTDVLAGKVGSHESSLAEAKRELRSEILDLKRQMHKTRRILELLSPKLEEESGAEVGKFLHALSMQGSMYFAFENVFRGPREEIKARQQQYLRYIVDAFEKSEGLYLLDIGCGRGEFLEILSENGVPARGIDLNEENVSLCRGIGLDVEVSDALETLKLIDNDSLIGITAFQVVEHLETEYLLDLIKVSFEKISKGGVIILETVNPYSLFAIRTFYIDPSHKNPLPLDTLRYIMQTCGFKNTEVILSAPVPEEVKLRGDDENTRKLNDIVFGPQNYAVVGRK